MSDPVLALVLLLSIVVAAMAVRYFRTLDDDFWQAARNPILAGVAAGFAVRITTTDARLQTVVIGVVLTLAALYSRLTGDESEPSDGMLLGAVSGAAASAPLAVFHADDALQTLAQCVLAGAAAGFGITWAVLHVADKSRQILWDIATAAAAVSAAWIPALLARAGIDERRIAIGSAAVVPVLVIGAVFKQWPEVRAELRHEATLGFIDERDVRTAAHPLLRFGRGGWTDRGARREFVRIANQIALRKRQQRVRPGEMARLYQLEVIKLRMQLQGMMRIERAAATRGHDDELPSDTMRASE
ncbi:MAG TPA: hypothetical protein VFT12_12945 [Thermoanaerobaculia bacterium]|nr:hypothetical protein [Thermoanaerobaculia bacterium]